MPPLCLSSPQPCAPTDQVRNVLKQVQAENAALKRRLQQQDEALAAATATAVAQDKPCHRCAALSEEVSAATLAVEQANKRFQDADLEATRLRLIVAALKVGGQNKSHVTCNMCRRREQSHIRC